MSEAAWQAELAQPTEGFFRAFAARLQEPDGPRDAVREAVKILTPLLDWEAYLPHVPHGLLGLRAVYRLRPLLSEGAFHRALATQLHALAHEGRRAGSGGLKVIGKGSGHWGNVRTAVNLRKPGIAYGELLGVEAPSAADFHRLGDWVAPDMANVGHKAVMAHHLGDLFEALDQPKATGRRMLALAGWLGAVEPVDLFWRQRSQKRLGEEATFRVPAGAGAPVDLPALQRLVCDRGLVELLDRWTAHLKAGAGGGDLLTALVLAASEKQLDARRDLEGKTSWTFVYLAMHALHQAPGGDPHLWTQAAALVNLFPTDEAEDRVRPALPKDPQAALLDAVLDGEPPQAMGLALRDLEAHGPDAVLRTLAEVATHNDPSFNHSHQLLAVAAAADLLALIASDAQAGLLVALAKSLANSQGSADLGRLADRALRAGSESTQPNRPIAPAAE